MSSDQEALPPIEVAEGSEFFISVAKQGIHSFMMLGVIDSVGNPRLLARVGKTNDIDPDFKNQLKMAGKAIGPGTVARLADEGLTRKSSHTADIMYQAYSVTFNQAKDFLLLIYEIEKKQRNANESIDKITCYGPGEAVSGKITFEYMWLEDLFTSDEKKDNQPVDTLARGMEQVQIQNTCRTSALAVVESVLGFKTAISKYFFIAPKYKTQLIGGQPATDTFYIFPAPPTAFVDKGTMSSEQQAILNQLYQQLEKIPHRSPGSPETRQKFNALKTMYNQIAGENHLTAGVLLTNIVAYENDNKEALYQKRSPGFFSRTFSLSTSSTQKMMKQIIKTLQEEEAPLNVTKKNDMK